MFTDLGHLNSPRVVSADDCVTFTFTHQQDYQNGPAIELRAYYDNARRQLLVSRDTAQRPDVHNIKEVASRLGIRSLALDTPLPLSQVHVAKPWGQEIWYSGIEARGVCCVADTPLPYFLAACALLTLGSAAAPVLLKILDPHPDPVWGDLYFEAHEEKQEVYVVTAINRQAWPSGVGKMKFGFNQQKVAAAGDASRFRQQYLQAVNDYREVRQHIDGLLDAAMSEQGLAEPLQPSQRESLTQQLPPALVARETERRMAMDSFVANIEVREGDVITVPRRVPHSLQHGIRVIEFQTPHYERYILSFAQKVLTQPDWDTEAALARIDLGGAEQLQATRGDVIADFPTFTASRIQLDAGANKILDLSTYGLLIGVTGTVTLGAVTIEPEAAYYLTEEMNGTLVNGTGSPAAVLLAVPK